MDYREIALDLLDVVDGAGRLLLDKGDTTGALAMAIASHYYTAKLRELGEELPPSVLELMEEDR